MEPVLPSLSIPAPGRPGPPGETGPGAARSTRCPARRAQRQGRYKSTSTRQAASTSARENRHTHYQRGRQVARVALGATSKLPRTSSVSNRPGATVSQARSPSWRPGPRASLVLAALVDVGDDVYVVVVGHIRCDVDVVPVAEEDGYCFLDAPESVRDEVSDGWLCDEVVVVVDDGTDDVHESW